MEVCARHGASLDEVIGTRRLRHIVAARHAIWILMWECNISASHIGRLFKRNHASVLHGIAKREET